MKNLVWAVAALIIIIVGIFVFASQRKEKSDTLIPSPIPLSSPTPNVMTNQTTNSNESQPFPILSKDEIDNVKVRLSTVKGDIVIKLFSDSPIAASNFINLTKQGFYDGLTFHRREEGFVIQGGDPNGNGTGGPGYTFVDEPVTRDYRRGTVAMANAGPNTNGSQFFIILKDAPQLPKQYTIFGNVIEGMEDVVDKIEVGDVINKATLE